MTDTHEKPNDVIIYNHGSLIGFQPQTEHGETWIEEEVDPNAQWLGPTMMVEARFAEAILDGMIASGLRLQFC